MRQDAEGGGGGVGGNCKGDSDGEKLLGNGGEGQGGSEGDEK